MSLEEELKQESKTGLEIAQQVRKERDRNFILKVKKLKVPYVYKKVNEKWILEDYVLRLLRVRTEKIRELFAKLAEKEECYPKSVGDEWYFIDVVESKHILKLKKELLAELEVGDKK